MRVHVPLQLVINCMWLLKNVYFPWTTKSHPAKNSESNLQDVTSRYGLVLHDDSIVQTSSRHVGKPQHLAKEVPSSQNVTTASLHLSHLTDNNDAGSEAAPEQQVARNADEVPSIVVQSPTSDEATFTLGKIIAEERRNNYRNRSLGNPNHCTDSETDSKKPKRGQKHFSPKRNIAPKDESLKERGDVTAIGQGQLNTSPVAAMATVTRSKPPAHSLNATEETFVASKFESSEASEASSWMSSLVEDEMFAKNSRNRLPEASPQTVTKSSASKEALINKDRPEEDDMEVFLVLRSKDGNTKPIRTEIPLVTQADDSDVDSYSDFISKNSKHGSCVAGARMKTSNPVHDEPSQHQRDKRQIQSKNSNKFSSAAQTVSENTRDSEVNTKMKIPLSRFHEQFSVPSTNAWLEQKIEPTTDIEKGAISVKAPLISFGTQTDTSVSNEPLRVRQLDVFHHESLKSLFTTKTLDSEEPTVRAAEPGPYFVNTSSQSNTRSQVSPVESCKPTTIWPTGEPFDLPLLYIPTKPSPKTLDISNIKLLDSFSQASVRPLLNLSDKANMFKESNLGKLITNDRNEQTRWPLLRFTQTEQMQKPNISNMKLLDKPATHNEHRQPDNWPLLHLPKEGQAQKPDLSKMNLLNKPEIGKVVDLPLLKFVSSQQLHPKLVPYKKLFAFQQSKAKLDEKENVVPNGLPLSSEHVELKHADNLKDSESTFVDQPLGMIQVQATDSKSWESRDPDQRNSVSRQRRRQQNKSALETNKKTINRKRSLQESHSRETPPINRATQKVRKKKGVKELASSFIVKKTNTVSMMDERKARIKNMMYYESLSEESELDLSKLSNLDSSSNDEKYFCVDAETLVDSNHKESVPKHFDIPGPPVLMHYQRKRLLEEEDKLSIQNALHSSKNEEEAKESSSLGGLVSNRIKDIQNSKKASTNTKITADKGVSVNFEDEAFKTQIIDRRAIGIQVEDTAPTDASVKKQDASVKNEAKTVVVQTEETLIMSNGDKLVERAPVLPPDIFMNLNFSGNEVPDADKKDDLSKTSSASSAFASNQFRKMHDPLVTPTIPGRQFLSVADIDQDEWLKSSSKNVSGADHHDQNGPRLSATISLEAQGKEEEMLLDKEQQKLFLDETKGKSPTNENVVSGPDQLTVKLFDSAELPLKSSQRIKPCTASKHWIKDNMKQMTETMDAIEQINDNMDRDLHSSRMLMNAIERLGDAVFPIEDTLSKRSSLKYSQEDVIQNSVRPLQASESRDALSEKEVASSQQHFSDDFISDNGSGRTPPYNEEQALDSLSTANGATGCWSGSSSQVGQSPLKTETDEGLRTSDESRRKSVASSYEGSNPLHQDRNDEITTSYQNRRKLASQGTSAESLNKEPLQSLKVSQEKLKEILGLDDKGSTRLPTRTAVQRKELKEWMRKKQAKQHRKWTREVEERQATEHKPFISQGVSNSKKIKLAERERKVKRRVRESEHYEERMKSASKLLGDMLTERLPDSSISKPNLHSSATGRPLKTRNMKSYNDRYKRKAVSMRKNMQQLPIKKDVTGQEVTNVLIDDSREEWRHSTPVWSLTKDIGSDHADRVKDIRNRTRTSTGKEFVTLDSYRRHKTEQHKKSQEFEQGNHVSYEAKAVAEDFLSAHDDHPQSPSGPNFITSKSWERYRRGKPRISSEFQEAERLLRQYGELEQNSFIPRVTRQRESESKPIQGGSQEEFSQTDVDKLLEDIPDGSEVGDLGGLQSLLNEDVELKELLVDVFSSSALPDSKVHREHQSEGSFIFTRASREENEFFQNGTYKISQGHFDSSAPQKQRNGISHEGKKPIPRPRPKNDKCGDKTGTVTHRTPSRAFGVTVSPWSTNDNLEMSEDITKLLAEAKEAVGEDFSESSGSIMSNIDWQAVDRLIYDEE